MGTSYPFFVSFFFKSDVSMAANKPTTPVYKAVVIEAPVAPGVNGEGQAATKV